MGSLPIGIGTIIGIFKCRHGESACNEWNTEGLDNLTNVILIHDIIAGIWAFKCVLWKILIPLYKYLDITCPVYEGELVEILHTLTYLINAQPRLLILTILPSLSQKSCLNRGSPVFDSNYWKTRLTL